MRRAAAIEAPARYPVFLPVAALPDWHGGVRWCSLPSPQAHGARAHSTVRGSSIQPCPVVGRSNEMALSGPPNRPTRRPVSKKLRPTRRCARYFRFDRYLTNAKVPRARTMTTRIDTSPIPNILQPPVIPSMLVRLSPRCAESQARGTPTQAAKRMGPVCAYMRKNKRSLF
jgi:hypothetical protein